MALWLIRAGKQGDRETVALESSCAIVGWDEVPDLSKVKSRDELRGILQATYPNEKPNTIKNWESQIWPLLGTIVIGDTVALPMKTRSTIALGKVKGKYEYRSLGRLGNMHTLPVEWLKELPRNKFDQDLLYSLGAFMTVCRIERNKAEDRVQALLSGSKIASSLSQEAEIVSDPALFTDIERLSQDYIRSHLTRKFKGHKLSELVAGIFIAQGFKVKISPPGPDGGIDIIAGKGPLGFDQPRLAIQVKSQDSQIDVKELREFRTTIKDFGAQQGIFVAWGGYNKSAAKEALPLFFELCLWDADDVVSAVQENYDRLPDSLQLELPLKRIWTIVHDEELE